MKFKRISIIFILMVTLVQCNKTLPIQKHELVRNNPTDHVFNISYEALHDSILVYFNDFKDYESAFYKNSLFYYTSESSPKDKHIIHFKGESVWKDAIYLRSSDYWLSPIYHSKGTQLQFCSPFMITLKEIEKNKTLLSIQATEPYVINGTVAGGPHFTYARLTKVENTTIEEYTLILFIAEQLGDTTLDPLITKIK